MNTSLVNQTGTTGAAPADSKVGGVEMDCVKLTVEPNLHGSSEFQRIASRLAASEQALHQGQGRVGGVEMDEVALIKTPHLEESAAYKSMTNRLQVSEAVIQSIQDRGDLKLDVLLTQALDQLVSEGDVEGLMIGSQEGFVVAQSTTVMNAEVLAALGSLFEQTVQRIQRESIIASVEEMTLRGFGGEQVVMRYFPGMEKEFFLVAYAKEHCTYRRVTTRALKICGDLLAKASGKVRPKSVRAVQPRTKPSSATIGANEEAGATLKPGAAPEIAPLPAPLERTAESALAPTGAPAHIATVAAQEPVAPIHPAPAPTAGDAPFPSADIEPAEPAVNKPPDTGGRDHFPPAVLGGGSDPQSNYPNQT